MQKRKIITFQAFISHTHTNICKIYQQWKLKNFGKQWGIAVRKTWKLMSEFQLKTLIITTVRIWYFNDRHPLSDCSVIALSQMKNGGGTSVPISSEETTFRVLLETDWGYQSCSLLAPTAVPISVCHRWRAVQAARQIQSVPPLFDVRVVHDAVICDFLSFHFFSVYYQQLILPFFKYR